jgi:hypothetical protein
VPKPREINFRSQQDFRRQLVGSLLGMGKGSKICPKRRISRISEAADLVPVRSHELVKIANRGICVSCKGLRYGDQLRKRVALSEIAANQRRESVRHEPFYGYK